MTKQIIEYFKKVDILTYNIMKKGLLFTFIVSAISGFALFTYSMNPVSLNLYYTGLTLFRSSCTIGVEFIICGLAIDTIKKQLI